MMTTVPGVLKKLSLTAIISQDISLFYFWRDRDSGYNDRVW